MEKVQVYQKVQIKNLTEKSKRMIFCEYFLQYLQLIPQHPET